PYVLIEWRRFLRENVYSAAASSCDLYIWSNFIHNVTSSDDVCPARARTTAIAVLLFFLASVSRLARFARGHFSTTSKVEAQGIFRPHPKSGEGWWGM